MWWEKVKKNKKQFFLIGVMLCITTTVFCVCLSYSLELKAYAKYRFSKEYCADIYAFSVKNVNPEDNIPEEEVRNNIESVSALKGKNISVPLKCKDRNISGTTNYMCVLEENGISQYMERIKGDVVSEQPRQNEVWISKPMATAYGIEIGDIITVCYEEPVKLKVASTYTSTFTPSERFTFMPNIVNAETLKAFSQEEDGGVLAINLKDYNEENYSRIAMGNKYAIVTMDRATLQGYITKISGVVGSIAAIAGLIVFLVALFIIRFIINNQIGKELNSIGIYKSLGYEYWQIEEIYNKGFMLVGAVSITLGAAISCPISYALGAGTSEVLGKYRLSSTTFITCFLAVVVLFLLLMGCSILSFHQIRKISPVRAISAGYAMGEHKISGSIIRSAKTPLETQINELVKHKKTTLITLAVLTISFYLLMFFSAGIYSCSHVYENANKWLACPQFDCVVSGSIDSEASRIIASCDSVETSNDAQLFYYPPVQIHGYDGNSRAIAFFVLSDLREETTGVQMREGYAPKRADEIAISRGLLKKFGKKVGDYVTISLEENTADFLVTATFDTMETSSVILSMEGMRNLDSDYVPGYSYIQLKQGADFNEFKQYIETNIKEVSVDRKWSALQSAVNAIGDMLTSIMVVLLIVFVLFAVIAIVNMMSLTMNGKKRQYGILKSLGFTNGYIIRQNLCNIVITLGISLLLSFLLHWIFSKKIFAALVIDAMSNCIPLTGGIVMITVTLILFVTFLMSLPIGKITPVCLMEE